MRLPTLCNSSTEVLPTSAPGTHDAALEMRMVRLPFFAGAVTIWALSPDACTWEPVGTPAVPRLIGQSLLDQIDLSLSVKNGDYEGELAVVIGRRCRHVPRDRAAEVIAGYMVCNDVSIREPAH